MLRGKHSKKFRVQSSDYSARQRRQRRHTGVGEEPEYQLHAFNR